MISRVRYAVAAGIAAAPPRGARRCGNPGTTYQIGHEALAEALDGRIDIGLSTIKAAIRMRPENRIEILIAAATEALQTQPNTSGIELALQMLGAVASSLDTSEIEERR